jgi:hypothetical protein
MDPRNYLGLGSFDLVQTKLMETAYYAMGASAEETE